ncbi:hypothetical protein LKD70_16325 [Ruminococcus sp. CLA-AA-H200]|uniref:Uncharacterized protein n=1 Tax=Ruminococcus turbiniformis TaxID=2881258 RepID=A0ABS8G4X2_9FIRM|nr:hypothetical protein [Ruminococcus turbiniformis]MCC2255959.1 hypothetical protein [Ruminococcus turbiniformis]
MKVKRVSNVMWPYIRDVMIRDSLDYSARTGTDDTVSLMIPGISNRRFSELLEDAKCEKQRKETESEIPVYSYRTLKDKKKRDRMFRLNGKRCFHVLRDDACKCIRERLI